MVENDEKGVGPKQTRTQGNIVVVADMAQKCRISSRMTAESLNIPKTVAIRTVKEDL